MKKLLSFIGIVFIFTSVVAIAPANAVIPPTCIFDSPKYHTPTQKDHDTVESYDVWLKRQKTQQTNPACYKDVPALKKIYNALAKVVRANIEAQDLNDYNSRYDACLKAHGGASVASPSTWGNPFVCIFTVSFFPTGNVINEHYQALITEFKQHQPTSYIPIALGIINNVRDNWGGTNCTEGSIGAHVPLPSKISLDFNIPCKPISALGYLRNFAVISLWMMFAFWLYNTVIKWWRERQS
jgi:hypothetical protein